VFEQRGHHQFEPVATRAVEQQTPQVFNASRLGRQDIGDVLGQQPR
jgi:hypothetical protein